MTSTICGSGQYYTNEIFKIVRVDRLKRHTLTYIFVGEQERNIKDILYGLESSGTISAKDNKTLKEHFGKNYNIIGKHQTARIKFIYQRIYTDDTIAAIRKKIFCFLSTQQDLLIEQNQELWVEMDDKVNRILGPIWTNVKIEPSITLNEVSPNYKKFVSKNGHIILNEQVVNMNDRTLYDATDGMKFRDNEIYLHMMEDEIEYIKSQGKKIDEIMKNGYLIKYWPLGITDYDPGVVYNEMEKLKPMLKAEDKLINFVETVPADDKIFGGCRIIQVLIHITNDYEGEFVELLKIFNLFSLDEKTPFMRYKDYEWPAPLYLFYKPLVENKTITEKQMKDWVSFTKKVKDASDTVIKEVQYSIRGLTLKVYIYTLDDEPKYATVNIHRNGNIEVRIAFKEKKRATMKDVYMALKDVGKVIRRINEIDYRFRAKDIPKTAKLQEPDITFNESKNLLEFHGRTRLILLDTINTVNIPEDFNYEEMNTFATKYFTPFLSPILSKKNYEKTELLAKYKRVSFYSKMNLEYEFIHKTIQQNPNIAEKDVIILLHENYYSGRPIEEAIKVYGDWKRKYGFMGSQGVKGARQTGIEIRIKHSKMHMNGSKNVMQLTNASMFMAKFFNIYFNQSQFLKKSQIRNIFSNELAKLEYVENEVNETILNNSTNIVNYANYNYGNTLGNIYGNNDFYVANVVASTENMNENIEKEENENDFNREAYLSTDEEIDRNIRMQCDDKDKKHDVCTDFCEDEFYTLRRLQKYDNPIFKYKSDPRFENYARKCQPQERQPLVMKNNPATNPKIDPAAYKNAIQYGSSPDRQNWYICAQVWCPYEEIPISYAAIEKDIKIRPTRKGNCLTAKCPSCLKEKRITWLRIVDKSLFHPYVGFIDESNHPNNLCMPCCFKKPMDDKKSKKYAVYMKCMGKNVDVTEDVEGVDYIMGRDKMPLTRGRFGLLPVNLAKLFKSPCETGKMQMGITCHLRYGVKDDAKQSFLWAIDEIIVEDKQANLTKFKKYLFEEKLTEKMFKSLNQGELEILFENDKISAMENFKNYMMSDTQKITEEFLWDFLSRPGILDENGLNIYIFTSKSLLCPLGFDAKEFFSPSKKSVFLYTDGRYYEPIFVAQNNKGKIFMQKTYSPNDWESLKVYNMAITNCISKRLVDWNKIRKESLGEKYFEIKPEILAREIIEKYKDKISGQLIDKYNKAVAFVTENNFILPFKPQGQIVEIATIDRYKPQSFRNTLKFYYEMRSKYGFPYLPVRVYKNHYEEIVAIQLENNSIIPVKVERVTTGLMEAPGKYYYDVNDFIAEGKAQMDERAITTRYIIYIQESYDRLRMELSRKLSAMPAEREKIIKIIWDKELSLGKKRYLLGNIIEKICKSITKILSQLPFPIENYVKPLLRRTCQSAKDSGKCLANPHCTFSGGECRLIILEKGPDGVKLFPFFVERITDELLRNNFLRDEILEDRLDEIVEKSIEIRNDEIVIYGAQDLLFQITDLYKPKKEFILKNEDMYSTTEPTYEGINKEKYLTSANELSLDALNLQDLPSYWKSFFKPNVKYLDDRMMNDTLYFAILRVLMIIMPEVKTVNGLKNLQIDKIEGITKQDIDKEPRYKNLDNDIIDGINRTIAIYKSVNGTSYKNINTMTQLKEFIMSDEYPANEVDVFLLSQALGINMIILNKRVNKQNPMGFYGFIYSLKKDFVVLLEQTRGGKNIFSILVRGDNYIFKRRDLPKNIKDFYGIKDDEADIIKYDVPHISSDQRVNQDKGLRSKLIKIKLAKKKLEEEKKEFMKK